jgi:hypothetical protein
MNVIRLAGYQLHRPPHRDLRRKSVFDSRGRTTGAVENPYGEEDNRDMRFFFRRRACP